MEAVKDIKQANGVFGDSVIKKNKENKENKENKADINKITDEDLSNLKQIFTWALTVTTRDRQVLASILAFEDILFKKLTIKK